MITKGALLHRPKSNYSYCYTESSLHIRLRALKDEVKEVWCRFGDPFLWNNGDDCEIIKMELEATTTYHDYFFVEVMPPNKRIRYAFIVEDEDEKILYGERRISNLYDNKNNSNVINDIGNYFCFPYINKRDIINSPTWAKDAIWYQIFPDRFCNGDNSNDPKNVQAWGTEPTWYNYMGGDLQGVIDRLEYLSDIGITGIHFTPLFKADKNHKYETLDYYTIDPDFGSNELFDILVKEAHKRSIKIMLDGVFNHVGVKHPFFLDVIKNGKESKYFNWFYINEWPIKPRTFETYGIDIRMPRLNYECQEVINYFINVGKYWIQKYNIDGWRLDVSDEVSHDFWKQFRREIKRINNEVLIVGEMWHQGLPWIMGDQFDSVMNYTLTEVCIDFFARKTIDSKSFVYKINEILVSYPKNAMEVSYNLLNSHDTSRFLSIANDDIKMLILAYVFIFSLPGSVSIYYGDEIGLSGEITKYNENHRRCMIWDEKLWNKDIRRIIKKLCYLRTNNNNFISSQFEWVLSDDRDLIIYRKNYTYVFLNRGETSLKHRLNHKCYENIITGKMYYTSEVEIKPRDFLIIHIK